MVHGKRRCDATMGRSCHRHLGLVMAKTTSHGSATVGPVLRLPQGYFRLVFRRKVRKTIFVWCWRATDSPGPRPRK